MRLFGLLVPLVLAGTAVNGERFALSQARLYCCIPRECSLDTEQEAPLLPQGGGKYYTIYQKHSISSRNESSVSPVVLNIAQAISCSSSTE